MNYRLQRYGVYGASYENICTYAETKGYNVFFSYTESGLEPAAILIMNGKLSVVDTFTIQIKKKNNKITFNHGYPEYGNLITEWRTFRYREIPEMQCRRLQFAVYYVQALLIIFNYFAILYNTYIHIIQIGKSYIGLCMTLTVLIFLRL